MTLTTRTITPAEVLTVPGDLPGMRAGYVGPALHVDTPPPPPPGYPPLAARPDEHGWIIAGPALPVEAVFARRDGGRLRASDPDASRLRLPVAAYLVRAHLVDWMARGERCPESARPEACAEGRATLPCHRCGGTGWLRPRHDLFWALKPEALGGPPEWIAAALIWASVLRVAKGFKPIVAVYGPRRTDALGRVSRQWLHGDRVRITMCPFHADNSDMDQVEEAAMASMEFLLIDHTPAGLVLRVAVPE